MNESIENRVAACYTNNLHYLQNNCPELYKKLSLLDFAIDEEMYEERYALEYMNDDYFDVKEITSGDYLYGENSVVYAQSVIPEDVDIAQMQKAIFFGCGLGTHIDFIDAQAENAKVYLIVEDNLELFRISLFVTDYAQIAKRVKIVFAVMEDKDAFETDFASFWDEFPEGNDYIPYFVFSSRYADRIKETGSLIQSKKIATQALA